MSEQESSAEPTTIVVNPIVEATDEDTDSVSTSGDSAYWEAESSTQSVSSSIYNYEEAHGRTYHAFHRGQYYFPNDVSEIERIEVKYHAVRLALHDNLHFAPINEPQAVLDVGTGTGIWCIDFADAFPSCIVKGIDLSPIQPNYVPPNCAFEIADADDDWTFTQKFDLIHTRIMNDFSLKSWPHFFSEAFTHLAPGGWVECQEFDYHRRSDDNTIKPNSRVKFWEDELTTAFQRINYRGGCDPEVAMRQMRQAGFTNVHVRKFKLPIGPWPKDPMLKEAGMFGLVNLLDGIYGLSAKLCIDVLGYSATELEILLMECRKELRLKKVHAYFPIYVILGQKPPLSSET